MKGRKFSPTIISFNIFIFKFFKDFIHGKGVSLFPTVKIREVGDPRALLVPFLKILGA